MLTLDDLDVAGQRIFLRSDLNVPLDAGEITDDGRIRASLPTIRLLLDRGAKVLVAAHLGRPKGVPDAGTVVAANRQATGRTTRPTGEIRTGFVGGGGRSGGRRA